LAFLLGILTGALALGALQVPDAPHMKQGAGEKLHQDTGARAQSVEVEPPQAALASSLSGDSGSEGPDIKIPARELPRATAGQEAAPGWARVERELRDLRRRIAVLEQREARETAVVPASRDPEETGGGLTRIPESRRSALAAAGVPAVEAEDIVRRLGHQELERLELRDRAIREGWYRSERYREELRDMETQTPRLREEIGELAYERYLFATGKPNRVRVTSVIEGSEAERAGLLPGDVIITYAESPMFNGSDVRGATTAGERGEMVPVQVMRGGSLTEAWLPRGPMGVRLDPVRIDPDA
jgi:hypothetical protein